MIFSGNIPHKQLLSTYGESSLLLLILTGYKDAEGFLPGKLFEYLATGLPILGVGPVNGDAANLLQEVDRGTMIASDNISGIKDFIKAEYSNWLSGNIRSHSVSGGQKYSRKEITRQLVELM
jgi:glycosyltransferase involved in cell wall biosynthesis